MATASCTVTTTQGQRLITRLGRHWAHKFDVTLGDTALAIPFSDTSRAGIHIQEDGIAITIETETPEDLETLQNVVAEHLQPFSKDQTLTFHWKFDTA